jgi:hypothetical protein
MGAIKSAAKGQLIKKRTLAAERFVVPPLGGSGAHSKSRELLSLLEIAPRSLFSANLL